MQLTLTKMTLSVLSLLSTVLSQNVTVPATCEGNFKAGVDEVIYTIPYTYAQTLSIIGSYKNLTWSGNPDNTVTLNGTNNKVGTARSYSLAGANLVETILVYDSPPGGPYYEVHNLALVNVAAFNLSTYAQYDATTVMSVCGGRATQFNFTARFCADNVTGATGAYHLLHTMDAQGVAKLLGGANFTSCAALGGSNSSSSTATGSAPVATYSSAAVGQWVASGWSGVVAAGVMLAAAL